VRAHERKLKDEDRSTKDNTLMDPPILPKALVLTDEPMHMQSIRLNRMQEPTFMRPNTLSPLPTCAQFRTEMLLPKLV
jgi:hypothetical protein